VSEASGDGWAGNHGDGTRTEPPHWQALRAYCRGIQAGIARATRDDSLAVRLESTVHAVCELAGATEAEERLWLELGRERATRVRPWADPVLLRAVAARYVLLSVLAAMVGRVGAVGAGGGR
jgi:hypothetical protein